MSDTRAARFQAEADRLGYQLEEIVWPPDMPAARLEQILVTRNVRGVLIPPCNVNLDWRSVAWDKFSLIRLGMSVPYPESHIVTTDHFREMQLAVNRMGGLKSVFVSEAAGISGDLPRLLRGEKV